MNTKPEPQITPEKDLKSLLLSVQTPGRYVGGEYGITVKPQSDFRFALCFPDLYEIGMSNLALRLIYREINSYETLSCERVFCPAPDFEEKLAEKAIPLYTLETGTPVKNCDVLGFSFGYELSAGNLLTVLNSSQIPLFAADRDSQEPLIIAGGPAITNPLPFGQFLDGVWIGEAEEALARLLLDLCDLKKKGAARQDLLFALRQSPHIWHPGKEKTIRSVWAGFTEKEKYKPGFIVPNISVVQDHGIVEIMRGCPNGCRFCHAGFFYRPFRQKNLDYIKEEINDLIHQCGYREITLSSLSSGDYNGIENLVGNLNSTYAGKHISFAFPSLKVSSMTFPLINEISQVRKSGLTFAVETPHQGSQKGLNKEVPFDELINLLAQAKTMGWKLVKFYFMLGLPFSKNTEGLDIAAYLNEIKKTSGMNINANIGTFIPKPHTPFQWAAQLEEEEAFRRLQDVRHNVMPGIKIGFHAPFTSMLEGILSRGDESVSSLIYQAWKDGARLDAWEEYLKRDIWKKAIADFPEEKRKSLFEEKEVEVPLPWDNIDLGYSKGYLRKEWEQAKEERMTSPCEPDCEHPCGACGPRQNVKIADIIDNHAHKVSQELQNITTSHKSSALSSDFFAPENRRRILFEFSKTGKAVFYSHINVMQIFERAFVRAGVDAVFTEGFNPKPRLEFAQPLALGQASGCEVAALEISFDFDLSGFSERLNRALPDGLRITRSQPVDDKAGEKIVSLMSLFSGSLFLISFFNEAEYDFFLRQAADFYSEKQGISVASKNPEELTLRLKILPAGKGSPPGVKKILSTVFPDRQPESYCEVFREKLFADISGMDYFSFFSERQD